MPTIWDDQKELLRVLNANGVEYVIVGGHAVSRYSEPRATKDLDLLLRISEANSKAVYRALAEFGAPMGGIAPEDFTSQDGVLQLGIDPVRIDFMQTIAGVDTEAAWAHREAATFTVDEIPVFFLSVEDLIAAKTASGRPQDLVDLTKIKKAQAELERLNKSGR